MDHADHLALLAGGLTPGEGGVWADLGAGHGAFTLALAELLGPGATIIAVDRDRRSLAEQRRLLAARFPATRLETLVADFRRPLALPPLEGAVMANSLHFLPDDEKGQVLAWLRGALRPGGRLLLVEYNTDQGNRWVPYPLSYPAWARLASAHHFRDTRLLARRPSRFLGEIYAAESRAGGEAQGPGAWTPPL